MTGMMKITTRAARKIILKVLHRARIVCIEGVAGTPIPGVAVLLIVITTIRAAVTIFWASACSAVQSDICLCFELRNI